jgi:thiol-disulfide isomerase/thioredoxin
MVAWLLEHKQLKLYLIIFLCMGFLNCNREDPTQFSERALEDIFIDEQGREVAFRNILESYKGKIIFVDVWASWCGDCLKSLPEVKKLQKANPDVVFLFLSVDKTRSNWKKGIRKYSIKGEHYFMRSGWYGDFGDFIDLDWTPRYMIVDKDQNIILFEAVKTNDERIKELLL